MAIQQLDSVHDAHQFVNFIVTNNNNALFAVQPYITSQGTLQYTLAAAATGVATVTVVLMVFGEAANDNIRLSAPQTFTIRVQTKERAPSDTYHQRMR